MAREPVYLEQSDVHNAPKLVMEAPAGDFAFGGIIRLRRCVQSTWSGGLDQTKKLVGKKRTAKVNDFLVPWNEHDRTIRRSKPLSGYNTLFCVAASREEEIELAMVEDVDRIRRGWQVYAPLAMGRAVNTIIDDWL